MSPTIRIPEGLYQRLGNYSVGFKTPADVIAEVLDFYEQAHGISDTRATQAPVHDEATALEFVYHPVNNVVHFAQLLCEHKHAYVKLYKTDGTSEIHTWNAGRFTATSSVEGNLRSSSARHWRAKGIFKVEVSVNKDDLR